MSHTSKELVWIEHFLQELGIQHEEHMKLVFDNPAAMHIASNPVFHERTKHIEVDCQLCARANNSEHHSDKISQIRR